MPLTPRDRGSLGCPGYAAHSAAGARDLRASFTNEFSLTVSYLDRPEQLGNPDLVDRNKLGYPYQGIFHNGELQMPGLSNWMSMMGYPQIAMMGGFNRGSLISRKPIPGFADTVSKTAGTHTLKAGFNFLVRPGDGRSLNSRGARSVTSIPWMGARHRDCTQDLLASRFNECPNGLRMAFKGALQDGCERGTRSQGV